MTRWDQPTSFAYRWHLRQDRDDATDVSIEFVEAGDGAEVRITHRGWERLGAKGPDLHQRNRQGWAGLLPHFQAACAT
ncbi:MAG: SRPBCC domain-containing protein [Actinomycetota bacterium]